jgi:adenylate cyclase
MTSEKTKRKLTTILSADVKGYSRLMGEDEEWTVRTLKGYKDVMGNLIQQHRGRVVDAIGDNLMAEFASVVDAVQSGVEIQQALRAKNALLPEARRVEFRIGINLGDVIEEGERIYGDGVNIAARLEGLAEAGGICISESAYQQVENKLPLKYEDLGEHQFKNIAKPLRVYRAQIEPEAASEKKAKPRQWRRAAIGLVVILIVVVAAVVMWKLYTPPLEAASKEKMAYPLPDKPSIAVMPFSNMTGDKGQEFFCDGISETLITALSKVPQLFVIARETTFSYKGKSVKVKQVAEDLGVQYVVEGSVQKAGDRVRVTAQLIDALKGYHLWSESYDRSVENVFDLQDEVIMKILTELRVKLTEGEAARIHAKETKSLRAYLKVLEGDWFRTQMNKEANAKAKRLFQEAIELDPNYAMPYSGLAMVNVLNVFLGASESPSEALSDAVKLAQRAIELDKTSAEAYAALGYVYVTMRKHDKAIEVEEQAVKLDPNCHQALFRLGISLQCSWRSEEAFDLLRQAVRLNPLFTAQYVWFGTACRETGKYEEGIAGLKKCLRLAPNSTLTYLSLVPLYMYTGRVDEARDAVVKIRQIQPSFSLEKYIKAVPTKEGPQRDRWIESLRKAGLT